MLHGGDKAGRNAVRGAETPDLFRKAHVRATHVLEARRSRRREWTVLIRARLHVYHHLDWGVEAVKQTPKAIVPTLSVIFSSARKSDRAGGDDDQAGRRAPALCRLATRDANHCALRTRRRTKRGGFQRTRNVASEKTTMSMSQLSAGLPRQRPQAARAPMTTKATATPARIGAEAHGLDQVENAASSAMTR